MYHSTCRIQCPQAKSRIGSVSTREFFLSEPGSDNSPPPEKNNVFTSQQMHAKVVVCFFLNACSVNMQTEVTNWYYFYPMKGLLLLLLNAGAGV